MYQTQFWRQFTPTSIKRTRSVNYWVICSEMSQYLSRNLNQVMECNLRQCCLDSTAVQWALLSSSSSPLLVLCAFGDWLIKQRQESFCTFFAFPPDFGKLFVSFTGPESGGQFCRRGGTKRSAFPLLLAWWMVPYLATSNCSSVTKSPPYSGPHSFALLFTRCF